MLGVWYDWHMIWMIVIGIFIFVLLGLPYTLQVRHSTIRTNLVKKKVYFLVLSDLHDRLSKKMCQQIEQVIHNKKIHAILLVGDIFDVGGNHQETLDFLHKICHIPTFYVSGNHDLYLEELPELKYQMRYMGITILDDFSQVITLNQQAFELIGLQDTKTKTQALLKQADALCLSDAYRIVLSHRPHFIHFYEKLNVQLIVSGHAHGGQWRIPLFHLPLYAPNQGFFPKYAQGVHLLKNGTWLLICRGIASGCRFLPRLFNRSELIILSIRPKK